MKQPLKKIVSYICIVIIFLGMNIPTFAGFEKQVLQVKGDGATPKEHQALTMDVDSVASNSPLQAFCIGWTFTFSNTSGSLEVYVPLSSVNTSGGSRTYTFPLTTGWTKEYTGIAGGKSIRDLVSDKAKYDKIIKDGCKVHADARIRKYSYSNGKYTPLNVYANKKAEIDSNFSEFTQAFKTNTKDDYFDLELVLLAEPEPYINTVKIQFWEKKDDKVIRRSDIQQNDIIVTEYKSHTETFTPINDIPNEYKIIGNKFQYNSDKPTVWTDYSTWNRTLYFPLVSPYTIGYLNILIQDTTLPEIITPPSEPTEPPTEPELPEKEKLPPKAIIDGPTKVRAGDEFTLTGTRSYCREPDATITNYNWSVPIDGVSGIIRYDIPGNYTVELEVTDSNGLKHSTTHDILVIPPTPTANIDISGKIKENRKITISARQSESPDFYPIKWDKVTWYIEPDIETGATWDFGVRLSDETVRKISEDTDQTFLTGQSEFYFQARNSGVYKVKLSVENTYPASNTIVGKITVAKDAPPVVVLEASTINLREYHNPLDSTKRKFGKTIIKDKSYSPDGDIIGKRIWCYRYNSNNNVDMEGNNIFADDKTQYMYSGDFSNPFLPEEKSRLVVENDNDTEVELWWYDVGAYRIDLIAEECIPDNETIKELLMPSDIRRSIITGW